MRDLVSKEVDSVSEDDPRGFPVTCTQAHTQHTYNNWSFMLFSINGLNFHIKRNRLTE